MCKSVGIIVGCVADKENDFDIRGMRHSGSFHDFIGIMKFQWLTGHLIFTVPSNHSLSLPLSNPDSIVSNHQFSSIKWSFPKLSAFKVNEPNVKLYCIENANGFFPCPESQKLYCDRSKCSIINYPQHL